MWPTYFLSTHCSLWLALQFRQMLSSRDLSQQARLNGQVHPPSYASTHRLDRAISSVSAYHSSLNGPGLPKIDPSSHDEPSLKRRISEIDQHDGINSSQTAVRRRISRACDQCNQLRTKVTGAFLTSSTRADLLSPTVYRWSSMRQMSR